MRHDKYPLRQARYNRLIFRVIGWTADLFRLAWGLLYWNTRKSLFRIRKGRGRCPCQSPSDSGKAFETVCEASLTWHRAIRFQRLCPLLVRTPDGFRCSVDTADVRPFWGRAFRYYGLVLGAIYLAGVITVFSVLRIVGYPISIVHVAWPGLWHRVPQARGAWFLARSDRALSAGKVNEGLLYLANAYEFDPSNYDVALRTAQTYQAGNPFLSDQIFERLLQDHPEKRDAISGTWLKALVARGNFPRVRDLAETQVIADPARANAWMRALIFSCRQVDDSQPLKALLANRSPAAARWRLLLQTELLSRLGRKAEARALLGRTWPPGEPGFAVYYQVSELSASGNPLGAIDELQRHAAEIDGESRVLLTIDALARAGTPHALRREVDRVLSGQPSLSSVYLLCAELVRRPEREIFEELYDRIAGARLEVTPANLQAWLSLLCAAGVSDDRPRFHALAARLKSEPKAPSSVVSAIEGFFSGDSGIRQASSFLPYLQLPLEMDYALLERYPPQRPQAAPSS